MSKVELDVDLILEHAEKLAVKAKVEVENRGGKADYDSTVAFTFKEMIFLVAKENAILGTENFHISGDPSKFRCKVSMTAH